MVGWVGIPLDACACAPPSVNTQRLQRGAVQLRSAGRMDSRDRRGPVVVSEEFTHDHVTEHDAVYINRAAEPRRGCCFHLEEQRKDWPADLRFLCFSRWGTQMIVIIINV